MSHVQRKRLFVDPKVQGALLLRVAMYWGFSLLSVSLMLLCWRIVTGPARFFYTHFDELWFHFGPAVVASVLLLPLVLVDALRLSNRFAGPLYRLRNEMRRATRGEQVNHLHFRDGDFWHEVANEFNGLLDRLHAAEAAAARSVATPPAGAASQSTAAAAVAQPPRDDRREPAGAVR